MGFNVCLDVRFDLLHFLKLSRSRPSMLEKSRKGKQKGVKIFQTYGKILNFYNAAGIYPFRWNLQERQIVVTKRNPISHIIKAVLVITHMAFLNYQSIRLWFTNIPMLDKAFLSLQVAVYTTLAVNFSLMLSNPSMITALINNVWQMQLKYDRPGLEDKGKGPRIVMMLALFICNFSPASFVLRLVKDPTNPRCVLSLMSEPSRVHPAYKAIIYVYQFYSLWINSSSLWFAICTLTVFLRTLISIIQTMKKSVSRSSLAASTSKLLVTCTAELSILLTWFNGVFRYWTLEWEVLFILLLVVNINVAVLTKSVRALLVAGPVFVTMMYLYTKMGEIFEESQDFS